MRKFCAAVGLSTVIAAGLGGCASVGGPAPSGVAADAYSSGKENFTAGHFGLALVDFQRALQEQGPSVERLNALGATYDRLGRFDLADRAYRQALALDPEAIATLNNIGYSYLLRGRADLAGAYLAKAHSLAKGDPTVGANIALAGEALNRPAAVVAASASVPSVTAKPEPAAPALAPDGVVAALPIERVDSPVSAMRPQHSAQIEPVAKGVYRLVTIPADPVVPPAPVHDAALSASIEIPPVIEPMPAVFAVPVAAVEREPLAAPASFALAARPIRLAVSGEPVAGIVRTVASEAESVAVLSPASLTARNIRFSLPAAPVAGIITAAVETNAPMVAPAARPETAAAIDPGKATIGEALIEVSNGSGIERSGARVRAYLQGRGVPVGRLTNASKFGFTDTILFYRNGFLETAQAIASELPMSVTLRRNDQQRSDLRLRLGLDSKPFDNYLVAGIVTASQ